jgi:hypothetical protein
VCSSVIGLVPLSLYPSQDKPIFPILSIVYITVVMCRFPAMDLELLITFLMVLIASV